MRRAPRARSGSPIDGSCARPSRASSSTPTNSVAKYDELFDEFFSLQARPHPDLPTRLLAQGFSRAELAVLRELLADFLSPEGRARLRALLSGGTDLDHLLASEAVKKQLSRLNGPLQKGFFAHQLIEDLGIERARSSLDFLKEGLIEMLDPARADELVRALVRELERSERRVLEKVEKHVAATVAAEQTMRRTDVHAVRSFDGRRDRRSAPRRAQARRAAARRRAGEDRGIGAAGVSTRPAPCARPCPRAACRFTPCAAIRDAIDRAS